MKLTGARSPQIAAARSGTRRVLQTTEAGSAPRGHTVSVDVTLERPDPDNHADPHSHTA